MKKGCLIGCAILSIIILALLVFIGVWLFTGPEGGVRLSNEMETYASEYLEKHDVLNDSESLLAYYDVTLSYDSSVAAILTTERVLYHNKGINTSISYKDIVDISHRQESLIGDIIEITPIDGQIMKIEIAMLNQGETFLKVLMNQWEKTKL